MKSLLDLTKQLAMLGVLKAPFNAKAYPKVSQKEVFKEGYSMSDETYGKLSVIYLGCPSMAARSNLERSLPQLGFKVQENYNPGRPTVAVQVTFFQGWHHDE